VETVDETTLPAVPLTESVSIAGDVNVRVSEIKAIDAVAQGIGEIAGPAVAVTVEVENGSSSPINLDGALVLLSDSLGSPGTSLTSDPSSPLSGQIDPGQSANGTYVFSVPLDQRDSVQISVSYSPEAPSALFTGSAS
jgi:hypothetical protein